MKKERGKMPEGLKIKKKSSDTILDFLKNLFESNQISGVITLNKLSENGAFSNSIISSPEDLKFAVPLYPLMPSNAGGVVGHVTRQCPFSVPIAVVLRPCELRALVELKKRNHANMDNLILISYTCPGVYPLEMMRDGKVNQLIDQYWNSIKEISIPQDIRPTCKGCEEFIPYIADITIDVIGNDDPNSTRIVANTEQGKDIIKSLDGESAEIELENERNLEMREKRREARKQLFEENDSEGLGFEGLIKSFGKCVGCHSCRTVCPICSCDLCYFDSRKTEYERKTFESEITRKKGIRLPHDTIFYQMGRMAHISISCVGCGQCADVCPVNIPVSTIFMKVGQAVQEAFDYVPGKDIEAELPVTTYEPEEFVEVGE